MQDAITLESTPVPAARASRFYGAAVPESSIPRPPRRSGDWLLYFALSLFAIGLVAIIAIFVTPIVSNGRPGLWLYLIAMTGTPLGVLLALAFALWSGRRVR
jgi:hypothetical protein